MKALDAMGYRAVGLGKHEMAMPLFKALAQYSIENPRPRPLNATLDEIEKKGHAITTSMSGPTKCSAWAARTRRLRVGVLSMTGPDLEDSFKADKSMKFRNNRFVVLPKILAHSSSRRSMWRCCCTTSIRPMSLTIPRC